MAKAQLVTRGGTAISIEGTPDEVAALVARLDGQSKSAPKNVVRRVQARKTLSGPVNLLIDLVDSGFLKTPRELNAIRAALEEQGHFYPATTLSPTLLRLVRKRQVRRIKENQRWLYVA